MKDPKQQVSQSRRKFLRDAGVSGGIAAVSGCGAGDSAGRRLADDKTDRTSTRAIA